MKKVSRILSLILCVVIVLTAFSSCSQSLGEVKDATEQIDDSVQLKLPVCTTDSFNPYLATTQYNLALTSLIFEGLFLSYIKA